MDFREATNADAPAIAALHTASWRSAYAHFMDPAYLNGDIEAERLAHWSARLARPLPGQRVILAMQDGAPAAFTCVVDGADTYWGTFIDNLHALPGAKGSGLGTALLEKAALWAISGWPDRGLFLWCYADNVAARGFYAARGGVEVEDWDKPGSDGQIHPQKRIHWADPATLVRR